MLLTLASASVHADEAVPRSLQLFAIIQDPFIKTAVYGDATRIMGHITQSGAVWVNADYEAGKSTKWWIEQQKDGGEIISLALATGGDKTLIDQAMKVYDWGFQRQLPDGSFPSLNGVASDHGKQGVHSVSLFVEGCARGLLLLRQSDPVKYKSLIEARAPKLLAAAQWILQPEQADNLKADLAPCTHRQYILAAAMGETAALTGDKKIAAAAGQFAQGGLVRQRPDGVNPEKNGFDVSYQCLGILMASRYYSVCPDAKLKAGLAEMIKKAMTWETGFIGPDGKIDIEGSTRTGQEKNHAGHVKPPDRMAVMLAFELCSMIWNDPSMHGLAVKIAGAARG